MGRRCGVGDVGRGMWGGRGLSCEMWEGDVGLEMWGGGCGVGEG